MTQEPLAMSLKYYGVSPWEIEVLYGLLHDMFIVKQDTNIEQDRDYDTVIGLYFPLEFNDEFFRWFGHMRWGKIKGMLKEMKRRRGAGKTIKTHIHFSGKPNIRFVVGLDEHHWFNTAIEKIDFILELLQYHLDPQKIPQNVTDLIYEFDQVTGRWYLHTAFSYNKKYVFSENGWRLVT